MYEIIRQLVPHRCFFFYQEVKMKKTIFQGIGTAIITPLDENGVNYEQFGRMIDWQIEEGINALVVCGTTGEGSTLTDEEHKRTIAFACDKVAGRVPVIAGTGSNDTAYGLQLTKSACESGVDGVLVVTPYYNKATQKGLIEMYNQHADASTAPVVIYNIPSRTGVNIEPATFEELAKNDNIVAIKEANGNISKIVDTMSRVHGKLDLYSGNDDQIVPLLALGAKGCISVLSNIMPRQTVEITNRWFAGDVQGAAELQFKYKQIVGALFSEVNPIPVKAACAALGICDNYVRLPLTPMEGDNYAKLIAAMKDLGLEVKE